jgi:hypothetical protein
MKRAITIITLITFLSSLIILSSCRREDSLDANQDRIYTSYELSYDENEDVTTVKVVFRLGGILSSKLKLSDGSNVTFNGQEVSYNIFYANYQNDIPGFVNEGTFVFTDLNGLSFTNAISFNSIAFPSEMGEITKGTAYEIEWLGESVSENESVSISIDGPLESDSYSISESLVGYNSATFTGTKTATFSTGASILTMTRSYYTSVLNAPSAGGKISTEYKAPNSGVTVVE